MAKMVKPEVQFIRFGEDVIVTSVQYSSGSGDGPVNPPSTNNDPNPW